VRRTRDPEAKKFALYRLATSGAAAPVPGSKDYSNLYNYTYPKSGSFDEFFTEKMKEVRPDWFPRFDVSFREMLERGGK